jgi:ATP-dependent Clp protease protease subunit
MKNVLSIVQTAAETVVDIFGEIGFSFWGDSVDAGSVRGQLKGVAKGSPIRVNIDSPGGSVSDAIAMFNIIRETGGSVSVHVQGIAASAGSYLCMAADPGELHMPANTLMMIHKPWLYTMGNSDDLRKDADVLDTFETAMVSGYMRHWSGTEDDFRAMMHGETWMTAAEAAEKFGAIVDGEPFKAAAMIDLTGHKNVPEAALAFGIVAEDIEPDDDQEPETPPAFDPETLPEGVREMVELETHNRVQGQISEIESALKAATERADARDARLVEVVGELDTVRLTLLKREERICTLEREATEGAEALAKMTARATEATDMIERIAGRAVFGGDSEHLASKGAKEAWAIVLERCDDDYVRARKENPEAYEAYRASFR